MAAWRLPKRALAVEDGRKMIDPLQWWKSHVEKLPNGANAMRKVILVQPSSVAAERVFSL